MTHNVEINSLMSTTVHLPTVSDGDTIAITEDAPAGAVDPQVRAMFYNDTTGDVDFTVTATGMSTESFTLPSGRGMRLVYYYTGSAIKRYASWQVTPNSGSWIVPVSDIVVSSIYNLL